MALMKYIWEGSQNIAPLLVSKQFVMSEYKE